MAQGVLSLGDWVRAYGLRVEMVLYYERDNCTWMKLCL